MDDITRLTATEDIRQLKARYWQGVDLKDAALLRSVFTEDAVIDFRSESHPPDQQPESTPSPEVFAAGCLGALAGYITAHHGHTMQITFRSDTEADGIWPMEDNLWAMDAPTLGFAHLHGFGLYYDSYRKTAAGWRISATTLKRLHVTTS
jgi:hypothetical protein